MNFGIRLFFLINLKSATKPFNVLLACTHPLITEFGFQHRKQLIYKNKYDHILNMCTVQVLLFASCFGFDTGFAISWFGFDTKIIESWFGFARFFV